MKYYFGKVKDDYFEDGIDTTEGLFKVGKDYYFYCLEFREEDVVIKDSCGRYIPMSYEESLDLQNAFREVSPLVADVVCGNRAIDLLVCKDVAVCI